jgi:hypothetical protein
MRGGSIDKQPAALLILFLLVVVPLLGLALGHGPVRGWMAFLM